MAEHPGTRTRWKWIVVMLVAGVAAVRPATLEGQQTLQLADGDQLTGSLVSIAGGTWVFNYRGQDVEVAAADVAAFTAPDPVGFRLSDNSVVAASVSPAAGGNLTLTLADGTTRTVAPADFEAAGDPADLEALQEVEYGYFTPFGRFWQMNASAGASFKSGNSETGALNARVDLLRDTYRDRLALSFLATQEENPNSETGDREVTARKFIGNLRGDIFPWDRAFLFAQGRYTRDTFADLDMRLNFSGGAGYRFVQTDNTDLRAAAGAGVRYEDFVSDLESTTDATLNANGQLTQKFGGFEFGTALDYVSAFDDFNDYQLLWDNSLTATIVAGLGFRVGLLWQFDNTPSEGFEKTDLTFITALNYAVGG